MPPGPEETFIFQKQRCELERGQAFHGKEAISLAIFERWNGGMEEVVRARLTPDLPPSAILRLLIEVTGEDVQTEADAYRVLMGR